MPECAAAPAWELGRRGAMHAVDSEGAAVALSRPGPVPESGWPWPDLARRARHLLGMPMRSEGASALDRAAADRIPGRVPPRTAAAWHTADWFAANRPVFQSAAIGLRRTGLVCGGPIRWIGLR